VLCNRAKLLRLRLLVKAGGGEERNITRHRVQSASRSIDCRRLILASTRRDRIMDEACRSRRLVTRSAFALRRDIVRHDVVDALVFSETSVRPSLVRTTAVKKPRTEWAAGCLHDGRDGRALFALEHREHKKP